MPTPIIPSYTEIFGGSTIYPAEPTFQSITTAIDVTLAWPNETSVSGDPIVAEIIEVNATAGGVDITLADARQVSTGYTSLFNNIGANTFSVKDQGGNTLLTVASGEVWQLYLADNTTANGTWRIFQYGAGASSANAAALAGAGLKAIATTLNQKMAVNQQNVNYPVIDGDRAKVLIWTGGVGTFTLPDPATLGSDWFALVRNAGSGNLSLTPAVGQIDGASTKLFATTTSAIIVCTGTTYYTIGFGQPINTVFDFITLDVAGTGDYILSGGELNRIAYEFHGILTGNRNIIVPTLIQQYWVDNETTGAFTLTVKTAAGTGVAVTPGSRTILYCDGTNVIHAETVVATVPVIIAQGGTGAITAAGARTNLDVPPNARTITAGAGLTGGGDLSADRTLDVGAGTGITVNANDVALSAGSLAALALAGTAVQPSRAINTNPGLTGGGDLSADRTLSVDTAHAFTWTAAQTFNARLIVGAPGAGISLSVTGLANQYAEYIVGANSAAQSYGLLIDAGTSAADVTMRVRDATGAVDRFEIFGDGGVVVGAATGGNQGFGSINANSLFVDGVPVGTIADTRTWQDETGSRALAVTYTNTSGVTIQVLVALNNSGASASAHLILNGIDFQVAGNATGGALVTPITFDVPNGATYQLYQNAASIAIGSWLELRP